MFLDILVKYKHVGVSEEVSQLFSENPNADTELHSKVKVKTLEQKISNILEQYLDKHLKWTSGSHQG